MTLLQADGVSAGYRGRTVLHGVDVSLGAGLHLLLGPNGAGKTTLFRTLAGVLTPSAGRVLIEGRDPATDLAAKRLVGVGAHRAALAPRLSVIDNLAYWAKVLGLPASDRGSSVDRALDLLELGPIAHQRANTLSRGQTQRVSLARAVLADPPVLLLDEPLAGVDPAVGARVRGYLQALAAGGRAVVVSTHELAEARQIGDDVTVLRDGRVLAHGTTDELRAGMTGRHRVRVRASGDLAGVLERLGYTAEGPVNGAMVVTLDAESAVEPLVAALVGAGLGVREVAPASNPLEELYLALQGEPVDAH